MKSKPEILAPCGGYDSVIAAVRCGADAIYIGGKDFSARQNAANFSTEEINMAVMYCHLHGVKVYVTVNTIIFDSEIKSFCDFICSCAEIGVDGLIVQDFGALKIIKATIPDIPVHSSTQMTIHTINGALFAKECGISRVVLARELDKHTIAEICKTGIQTEVFVHGALCMSVSGQCYMSGMLGSRSANRGMCAQPCRLPFYADNDDKKTHYMLSLKDLSLVDKLRDLSESGISSFKIEGRMKRPEYVAAAVTACVKSLAGENIDNKMLKSIFSRSGFTDGYYTGNMEAMFGTRQKQDVMDMANVLEDVAKLYSEETKKENVSFYISMRANKPIYVKADIGNGNSVCVYGAIPEHALKKPTDYNTIKKQFSKLGGTIYELEKIEADIEDNMMLPVSELNKVRREAIDALNGIIMNKNMPKYTIKDYTYSKKASIGFNNKSPLLRIRISELSQIRGINLSEIDYIIISSEIVKNNLDYLLKHTNKIIIEPPRFIKDENVLIEELTYLLSIGFKHIICNNLAYLRIGNQLGFIMHGDFGLNIVNSESLKFLNKYNVCDAVLSMEIKLSQAAELEKVIPVGIIAYGHMPLMLTRNCPIKNFTGCNKCKGYIIDRKGKYIMVKCRKTYGYAELLNPDVLYMADKQNDLNKMDFIDLMFYNESAEDVKKIIGAYLKGKCEMPKHYTRGLYYRGVE